MIVKKRQAGNTSKPLGDRQLPACRWSVDVNQNRHRLNHVPASAGDIVVVIGLIIPPFRVDKDSDEAGYRQVLADGFCRTFLILNQPADELDPQTLNAALDAALAACEAEHITGAAVTPFVLARIEQQTSGTSVPANLALAENNARVAAAVAAALTVQA